MWSDLQSEANGKKEVTDEETADMSNPTLGICGAQMPATPRKNLICDLPAGHDGWHSAPDYTAMEPGVLQVVPRADWSDENSPESKLARIEALCTGAEFAEYEESGPAYVQVDAIRAILLDDAV